MKSAKLGILMNTRNVSCIFLKEQLREPAAVLWSILYPCILCVMLYGLAGDADVPIESYAKSVSWFYTYIAATTALFGLSFYLIGRRESGFVRSFIYKSNAVSIFLAAHIGTHFILSVVYAGVFYMVTRLSFGMPDVLQCLHTLFAYSLIYLFFAGVGLIVAVLPLKFSSASTLFSVFSFMMLASGFLGASYSLHASGMFNSGTRVLINTLFEDPYRVEFICPVLGFFIATVFISKRYFRIQPVGRRY
ncbi:hypothetical protein [Pseudomonas phoenicis]|uniref:hypothetical protein n=1 Tax=unclassified Pseudomonas TaxID=196821 RepID=UPI0039A1D5D7